ncbi:MAG: acyclic terpene utilization AtuA family protein [Candidatus Malihini olakiniferum]
MTGRYYADEGFKKIPHLEHLDLRIAEIDESGDAVITKISGYDGCVCLCVDTCKDHILY